MIAEIKIASFISPELSCKLDLKIYILWRTFYDLQNISLVNVLLNVLPRLKSFNNQITINFNV